MLLTASHLTIALRNPSIIGSSRVDEMGRVHSLVTDLMASLRERLLDGSLLRQGERLRELNVELDEQITF